ncbi:MAG: hypothetical protein ACOC5M_03410, partial [Chloroflexota bacterium]
IFPSAGEYVVDTSVLSSAVVWLITLAAVALSHVLAVYLAFSSLTAWTDESARWVAYAIAAVLAISAASALWVLAAPITGG